MHLTIAVYDDRILAIEIDDKDDLSTLKAILEAETGLASASQVLYLNGRRLEEPSHTLESEGVRDGDLLTLERSLEIQTDRGQPSQRPGFGQPRMLADGSAEDPEQLMSMLLSMPGRLASLPLQLQDAVRSNNVEEFQKQLCYLAAEHKKAAEEEARFLRLAAEDPLNPEVQALLEKAIQQKNVAENFENALEHNPEAFASVVMLYVNMEVNGTPLKAFIDSGAQMTIMSKSCAERCGILRLMDTRFQGTAVGVGKAQILGRVHLAPLKAGGHHIPISITVLDQDSMEFLFGLDNLKRHECSIDLKSNGLRFPNMDLELPFLAEHEVPKTLFTQQRAPSSEEQLAPPPPPSPRIESRGFDEDQISRLMELGFSRDQCIAALQAAGGNEEMAGSLLFSMS